MQINRKITDRRKSILISAELRGFAWLVGWFSLFTVLPFQDLFAILQVSRRERERMREEWQGAINSTDADTRQSALRLVIDILC